MGQSGSRQGVSPRLIGILKKIPLFSGLDDPEYETLLAVCRVEPFQAGDRVFQEGDPGSDMYVLLSGEVEIETRVGGHIHRMQPGEILGEVAMVADRSRTATATARGAIFLLRLTRDDFDAFLARRPRLAYLLMKNIARALAQRLATTTHRTSGELELCAPPDDD